MQIIEECAAFLSDFEVRQHLLKQKQHREAAGPKASRNYTENVLTVEYEVSFGVNVIHSKLLKALEYLAASTSKKLSKEEQVTNLLSYFATLPLTKMERLQLINLVPSSMVEFYLVLIIIVSLFSIFIVLDC